MRISKKGQVTIPVHIRERLGLLPNTEVEMVVDGDALRLSKVEGQRWRSIGIAEHMRGRATSGLTTDEIMALTRGEP